MENLYREAEAIAKNHAEALGITDSWEIRKLICEELKKEMVKVGQALTDSLNIMGGDIEEAVQDGLLEGLQRSHRELQSNFWKSMLIIIKKYGDTEYFDGRNGWAVEMCKRMGIAAERYGKSCGKGNCCE